MTIYFLRRAGLSLLTLWLLTVIAFVLLRVAPGDAVVASLARSPGESALSQEQITLRRHELGLDRPYPVQYFGWLWDLLRLDPGRSVASGLPILDEVGPGLGVTLELAAIAFLFVSVLGAGLGVLGASARRGPVDAAVRSFALLSLSTPAFWTGLLIIIAAAAWAGVFLAAGYQPLGEDPLLNLRTVGVAAFVLAIRPAALLARVVRVSTAEALTQDFVRAARARGLSERAVLWRHAFRAAALPALTVLGAEAVYLLGGAVVIEQLFGLPGIGRALVAGVMERDYPLVQFLVLVFGGVALTVNLAVDVAYVRLDPRVRTI